MDHKIATKEHYNWAPRLIFVAFFRVATTVVSEGLSETVFLS